MREKGERETSRADVASNKRSSGGDPLKVLAVESIRRLTILGVLKVPFPARLR